MVFRLTNAGRENSLITPAQWPSENSFASLKIHSCLTTSRNRLDFFSPGDNIKRHYDGRSGDFWRCFCNSSPLPQGEETLHLTCPGKSLNNRIGRQPEKFSFKKHDAQDAGQRPSSHSSLCIISPLICSPRVAGRRISPQACEAAPPLITVIRDFTRAEAFARINPHAGGGIFAPTGISAEADFRRVA